MLDKPEREEDGDESEAEEGEDVGRRQQGLAAVDVTGFRFTERVRRARALSPRSCSPPPRRLRRAAQGYAVAALLAGGDAAVVVGAAVDGRGEGLVLGRRGRRGRERVEKKVRKKKHLAVKKKKKKVSICLSCSAVPEALEPSFSAATMSDMLSDQRRAKENQRRAKENATVLGKAPIFAVASIFDVDDRSFVFLLLICTLLLTIEFT